MKAKKQFGQNFLVDKHYIDKIIESINSSKDDVIIEIGPGRGALTKLLKNKDCNLIAFEIDNDLKKYLDVLEDDKTKVIFKDFLQVNVKDIVDNKSSIIVGNLPYYITTPLIEHIIDSDINIKEMIIMVQKEVADRFLAQPKTREYGYFTLYLRYYFDLKRIVDVPREAFNPIPNVDSTILKLIPRLDKPDILKEKYFKLLKDSFSLKRKTLKNNLKNYDWNKIKEILLSRNYKESVRAEEIDEETFIEITKTLL